MGKGRSIETILSRMPVEFNKANNYSRIYPGFGHDGDVHHRFVPNDVVFVRCVPRHPEYVHGASSLDTHRLSAKVRGRLTRAWISKRMVTIPYQLHLSWFHRMPDKRR
jgi:hypothetical protein